jgi:hypothetical protein
MLFFPSRRHHPLHGAALIALIPAMRSIEDVGVRSTIDLIVLIHVRLQLLPTRGEDFDSFRKDHPSAFLQRRDSHLRWS